MAFCETTVWDKALGKKKKVNRNWLNDHLNDPYVKQAQREGYRSRAVYKLQEIDLAHQLLAPRQVIVELGCAPGAWSQYIARKCLLGGVEPVATESATAPKADTGGMCIGLDMLPMEPVTGIHFIQGDFREDSVLQQLKAALGGRKVDVVVSDMAPNLSGIAVADATRMAHLLELALEFAADHLQPHGSLLAKAFHGSGYSQSVKQFKDQFQVVKPIKPKASRARSAETFVLGQRLKM